LLESAVPLRKGIAAKNEFRKLTCTSKDMANDRIIASIFISTLEDSE
jgi:hypothetical protein